MRGWEQVYQIQLKEVLRKLDRALMDIVKSEAKSESLGEQEAYTGGSPDESDKDKFGTVDELRMYASSRLHNVSGQMDAASSGVQLVREECRFGRSDGHDVRDHQ